MLVRFSSKPAPHAGPSRVSPRRWRFLTPLKAGLGLTLSLWLAACATLGTPRDLGYQGRLTDANGLPVNGSVSMMFRLYSTLSGGTAVFTETQTVAVTNGLFNANIGGSTPLGAYDLFGIDPALFAQRLYLQISVNGEDLTPRQRLGGAPYAMTLAPGAVLASNHEGNGAGGTDDTDANYATLSVIATTGTGLIIGTGSASTADALKTCSGLTSGDRVCPDAEFRVTSTGDVYADGAYHCSVNIDDGADDGFSESELDPCLSDNSPADFAEYLPVQGALEAGDVLAVNPDGSLVRSNEAYQLTVMGVYSTEPSYVGNAQYAGQDGYAPLAISGVVPVKVTNENGPVVAGDLLAASSTPGHAMRAGPTAPPGSIIGKALGSSAEAAGLVLMIVSLR
jgi:hypothetical protein